MPEPNPFANTNRRPGVDGPFHRHEVELAMRNSGILLEALHHDVTPAGLHYLLSHFDVPYVGEAPWAVQIAGRVRRPGAIALAQIMRLPARTLRVTLECAGNGRAAIT